MLFLAVMAAPAFAEADWRYLESKYTLDAPDELILMGFQHENPVHGMEIIQNMLEFEFIHRQECLCDYEVTFGPDDQFPGDEYSISFNLTYNKNSLNMYDDVFIEGTFDYHQIISDNELNFSGDVIGQIILFNPVSFNLIGANSNDVACVILRLSSKEEESFVWHLFLNPGGSGLLVQEEEINYPAGSAYDSREHRPHIPSPRTQADVASGIGLSTIGIVVANALTKTSVFGSASFNGSFDPTSASPGGQTPSVDLGGSSASAATGTGASTASVVQSSAPATGASGATSSGGGFIGAIKDFFRNLFANLRDMLTDEGRSYASGKLSETLDNVIPDDIDNE